MAKQTKTLFTFSGAGVTAVIWFLALSLVQPTPALASCASELDHRFRMLHSDKELDLCKYSDANALLLVNTASFCGFTHQFSGLEELHNAYAERGLVVIGFPSNDFRQEAQEETETAKVCYINYGVTFDMVSPVSVKGDSVHPLFQALAERSQSPGWNFNKYLVDPDTLSVIHFGSRVDPGDEAFQQAIEKML